MRYAGICRITEYCVKSGNSAFTAFQAKTFLTDEFSVKKFLKYNAIIEFLKNTLFYAD